MFTRAVNGNCWPTACVFDCDGLLLASGAAWAAAYEHIAHDLDVSPDSLDLRRLLGCSISTAALELGRQLGRPVREPLVRERVLASFEKIPPAAMPGAHTLLMRARERMRLAVATNGPLELIRGGLKKAGLDHYFADVVSAETSGRPKPAPDVYLRACAQLEVDPSDAVALEDSLVGAQSARAAGVFVIGVGVVGEARAVVDLAVRSLTDPIVMEFVSP